MREDNFLFEVSGLKIPNRDGLDKMRSIWAAWATCENLPSAQTVMAIRYKRMSSMDAVDPTATDAGVYLREQSME